jgi:hypothetical protein
MGWHSQGSLDAPSSPAASSRDPVLGLLLKWTALPLQASVGSKLRIAACADAATDERVRALLGPRARLGRDHAREQRLQTLRRSRGSFKPDDRAAAIMEAILG